MAIVKSKLLKQLSNNWPNFLQKDLSKLIDIILNEVKLALKRGDRVELRGFGIFSINIQKTIHFKMAKEMFKKLNNNE